jgi:hypothetical protein
MIQDPILTEPSSEISGSRILFGGFVERLSRIFFSHGGTKQLWFSASGKFWIFDEGLDVN